jgi:hypothetical protein
MNISASSGASATPISPPPLPTNLPPAPHCASFLAIPLTTRAISVSIANLTASSFLVMSFLMKLPFLSPTIPHHHLSRILSFWRNLLTLLQCHFPPSAPLQVLAAHSLWSLDGPHPSAGRLPLVGRCLRCSSRPPRRSPAPSRDTACARSLPCGGVGPIAGGSCASTTPAPAIRHRLHSTQRRPASPRSPQAGSPTAALGASPPPPPTMAAHGSPTTSPPVPSPSGSPASSSTSALSSSSSIPDGAVPVPPVINKHAMRTRGKHGFRVPAIFQTAPLSPVPRTYRAALADSN